MAYEQASAYSVEFSSQQITKSETMAKGSLINQN